VNLYNGWQKLESNTKRLLISAYIYSQAHKKEHIYIKPYKGV
jgi:hypothetical protein